MAVTARSSGVFMEPMLCLPVRALPEGKEWLYELKWDGYRAIASKGGRTCRLYSRNGKPFERDFPELLPELAKLRCRSAVIDGEVVAFGENGKPSFQLLQKRSTRSVSFVVFDLLALNGRDLRGKPLRLRRAGLAKILPKERGGITLSPELKGAPEDLLEQARSLQLEGIVAKRRDSLYQCGGRSGDWVKRRAELTGTFLVGGYVPGSPEFDELVIGEKEGKALRFVCRLKAGFVPATRRTVMTAIKPLVQIACPFNNLPESGKSRWGEGLDAEAMKKCRWVKPKVKVNVAFVERTEARKLRHGKFLGLAG